MRETISRLRFFVLAQAIAGNSLQILILMPWPPQSAAMSILMPNHMSTRLGGGRRAEGERGRKGEGCVAAGRG